MRPAEARAVIAAFCWIALAGATELARAQVRAVNPHGDIASVSDCAACHAPTAWRPLRTDLSFDHAAVARFPLSGRHEQVACASCHRSLRFDAPRATVQQCGACHIDVHRGRFAGTACAQCHDTRSFRVIDGPEAHARSGFPLHGAHLAVPCIRCHTNDRNGAFTRLDVRCIACHRIDLTRATFPDHGMLATIDCAECHGAMRWRGARFEHGEVTGFPLRGAHVRAACTACHVPPDFRLRFAAASADDCVACHRADYDRVHTGTGFSTQCSSCHGVERWQGATFEHGFPIFSGAHRGKWQTCRDCHTAPSDFSMFTCTTCHTRAETDDKHDDVGNYVYESLRCYACHPRGTE